MKLIDTHAHLYLEEFEQDLALCIENAKRENIEKVVLPNVDAASAPKLLSLWQREPNFFVPMMGLHPCYVKEDYRKELAELEAYFLRHKFASVGEIGLDYYWDTTRIKEQKEAFVQQINWAKDLNLPIAVHCREAFDDILSILEKEQNGNLQGVLHCFTGSAEQAQRLVDLGFYLGIGGVVTYKNGGLDKSLASISLNNLVLETDAPYLSPVPFRGKRNESAYLIYIAEKLGEILNISIEEIAKQTSKNAKELFKIA
ncbi:MAG: TatD family hydrolase [Chitinophagales bacterium]|nr:TatD family hydrolase [Bacteroidota bacterium]MCB9256402.1 TatD family hydrolase [Chitinophagales bacterium]